MPAEVRAEPVSAAPRRFPPPWAVEPIPAGWCVADATGRRLVFVYGSRPDDRGAVSDSLPIARAEAVAKAIADLPEASQDGLARPIPAAAPLTVEDKATWFVVTDANGYRVACIYCGDPRAGDLTWDEARRIATGVSKLAL